MSQNDFEPLKYFYDTYGFDSKEIKTIVTGNRFTATQLTNGNIGVCANLDISVRLDSMIPQDLDLSSIPDRIIYTSYLNAKFNYENNYDAQADIFQSVDFRSYKQITMIGYFIPLVEKFDSRKISLNVFDHAFKDERLLNEELKDKFVAEADSLIISGTTIQNGTFSQLLALTKDSCDIFLLGPSSIMHKDIFTFTNTKVIFGAVFNKHDERVMYTIKEGHGTREFLKFGSKVVFKRS